MSCSHEHHGHGDGHDHTHSHDDDSHLHPDQGPSDLLNPIISLSNVTSLNTNPQTHVRNVLKPWSSRYNDSTTDPTQYVESDTDDEMILRLPFEGSVKLKSILLKTGPGEEFTPNQVILFINQDPHLSFSDDLDHRCSLDPIRDARVSGVSAQKLESIAVTREVVEYPLRVSRFSNVRDLTLFVRGSGGGVKSRIYCAYVLGWV